MTKLTDYTIPNTIRGRMTRKEYWQFRKTMRAAYKAQQANASNTQADQG
jgi:hypothetical protein